MSQRTCPHCGGELGNVLTARERQLLRMFAEGKTSRQVADTLNLALKTVEAHRFNLMRKLGLHKATELALYAVQHGIVTVPVGARG